MEQKPLFCLLSLIKEAKTEEERKVIRMWMDGCLEESWGLAFGFRAFSEDEAIGRALTSPFSHTLQSTPQYNLTRAGPVSNQQPLAQVIKSHSPNQITEWGDVLLAGSASCLDIKCPWSLYSPASKLRPDACQQALRTRALQANRLWENQCCSKARVSLEGDLASVGWQSVLLCSCAEEQQTEEQSTLDLDSRPPETMR